MKTKIIKVNELERYFQMIKLRREYQVRLTRYLEDQNLQLKRAREIVKLSKALQQYKETKVWLSDKEFDNKLIDCIKESTIKRLEKEVELYVKIKW